MTHPPFWYALAGAYPSLFAVTNGLRILSMVIASAIVIFWWPSVWRCVFGEPGEGEPPRARWLAFAEGAREGDAHRAGWVPLAVAVLIFEARWFLPSLTDLGRGRMLVVAHGAMALALLSAVYVHGRKHGGLRIRRAMIVHAGMFAGCVAAATILR